MGTIYGYIRVSTPQQNPDRQIRNILRKYPDAELFQDMYTGTKIERPAFFKLLRQVKSGDTIIFDEVSRMSRSAEEGIALYRELYQKGITLEYLKEPQINTETYKQSLKHTLRVNVDTGNQATDAFMTRILDAINEYILDLAEQQIRQAFNQAQAEVDYLHKRTSEGIRAAQARGVHVGAPKGSVYHVKKADEAKEIIRKHCRTFGGSLTDSETRKLAGVSANTYYKYKRELRIEAGRE